MTDETIARTSNEVVQVAKTLILRCFRYVNERFQANPADSESGQLCRALNHEITRSRAECDTLSFIEDTTRMSLTADETFAGRGPNDSEFGTAEWRRDNETTEPFPPEQCPHCEAWPGETHTNPKCASENGSDELPKTK